MAKGWYVVNTYTGYEQKIQRTLNKMIDPDWKRPKKKRSDGTVLTFEEFEKLNHPDTTEPKTEFAKVCTFVDDPTEKVVEIVDGKEKESRKKILPGYIIVELDIDDTNWRKWCGEITRIQGVSGFLTTTPHAKPSPLSKAEVKNIKQRKGVLPKDKVFKPLQTFEVGETVKITDGPFDTFSGVIDDINLEKAKLSVCVGIFGRSTPVQVSFDQVEKIVK